MVAKAAKDAKKPTDADEVDTKDDAAAVVEAGADGSAVPTKPPVKRQLGVKEPIVFKWRVIGQAEGYILTLFKAVEREEAEAQLERLQKESYYENVRIVDYDEKIVQTKPIHPPEPEPPPAKPEPKPQKKKAAPAKKQRAAAKAPAKSASAKASKPAAKKKAAASPKRKKK